MAKSKLPIAAANTIAGPSRNDEMKWKAQDALQTIKRAEEYKSDKQLMKHVKACAKQEMKALKKL